MAFAGFTIMVSNIFNTNKHVSYECANESEYVNKIVELKELNISGDVLSVFEDETEGDGYLLLSWFNHPEKGWKISIF